jgi:hypothetical protein
MKFIFHEAFATVSLTQSEKRLNGIHFTGSNMQFNGVNRTASEAIRTVEIFSEGEQQEQLQQTKYVDDLSGNGNGMNNPHRF